MLSFMKVRGPILKSFSYFKLGVFKAIGLLPVVSKRFRLDSSDLRFWFSSFSAVTLDRSWDTWFCNVLMESSFYDMVLIYRFWSERWA